MTCNGCEMSSNLSVCVGGGGSYRWMGDAIEKCWDFLELKR
jgi:hypothetical protein